MTTTPDHTIAVFIDFENIALGIKDIKKRFEISLVLDRLVVRIPPSISTERQPVGVNRIEARAGHHPPPRTSSVSRRMVTGPSLISSTLMWAPNWPVATVRPVARQRSTKCS